MHSGGGRHSGGPRRALSGDRAVPVPPIAAQPDQGWIGDHHRRLGRAAVVPADAAVDGEVPYLRIAASGPAAAGPARPPGRGSTAIGTDQPGADAAGPDKTGPDKTGTAVPRLAAGVELIGEYQGSGLAEATYLARNPAGQVAHLSRLLYLVVSAIGGQRTTSEIADQVTAGLGRAVSAGNIEYLLTHKLGSLGLLATAGPAGPAGPPRADSGLLTLKLRRTIVPAAGVQVLARVFRPLFRPVVVTLVLTALIASDAWLFGTGRAGSASRYVLLHPLLVLLVLGLSITSMLFHECGHAAACRYGGARPGVIGMGIYLIWPAFFTNVTDTYRLGRAGRLRTDLGGVYFNAIFVLLLTAGYLATGYLPLVAAIVLIHLEIAQQLLPSLRFDGYFILADLIGLPDLFRRIGPTLRSLIPGRSADPRMRKLKRSARISLTIWVLIVVPMLVLQLAFVVLDGPSLARTSARSLLTQLHALTAQLGHAEIASGLLTVVSAAMLVLPMVGLSYVVARVAQSAFRLILAATRRRPALRLLALAVIFVITAGLAVHWGFLTPGGARAVTPRPSAAGRVTAARPGPVTSGAGQSSGTGRPAYPLGPPSPLGVVLEPVGAAGFDVEGLPADPGNENSALAPNAIDGNPVTYWASQYYLGSPVFGGLKQGTGLILDMGRPVAIGSVTVTFGPARGADVSIEVGNHDALTTATLSTFRTVARADDIGGTYTFTARHPARGRYLLVWFTKLPPAGSGRFAAKIFNIVVRGPG
jgi:putative peptide zinc metalloprotease protein